MKLFVLPSHLQRRRADGSMQPLRVYLADGTELKKVTRLEAGGWPETVSIHMDKVTDDRPTNRPYTSVTLEFEGPVTLQTITRKPRRTKP